jgi:L-ascorbate metabolism protein UlaG (beta-lactamase superfamily)
MLLAAGADRAARDSQGRTPLELAVRYGNRRVADALGGAFAAAAASSPAKPAPLAPAPKIGEAIVTYLGHMGWAVRTANHFMVFDYDGRSVPPDEPSLANGSINPAEIKDLSTTVFITHGHLDHYAPGVFDWKKTVKDIAYVAGFKPEGKEDYVFMAPRETKTLGGLDITTTMGNDEGVGFFVQVDGVTIFHSGDHSAAGGESFTPEIDFLAGRGLRADLLFMPISPTGDPEMNQGVHYAMTRLSAVAVFPGHVSGREDVAREFARDAAKAGMTAPIHCLEFGGDHFAVSGSRAGGREVLVSLFGTRTE